MYVFGNLVIDSEVNLRQAILALLAVDSDKDGEINWEEFQELFDVISVCTNEAIIHRFRARNMQEGAFTRCMTKIVAWIRFLKVSSSNV